MPIACVTTELTSQVRTETLVPHISIRTITAQQTVPLRHSVLWPDKPVEYVLLPEDETGYHFGVFLGDDEYPIAVIPLFAEDVPRDAHADEHPSRAPSTDSMSAARFRKFACAKSFQGRGVGTALLQHVLAVSRELLQCSTVWCDARVESAAWYERRGLTRFGGIFYKGEIEYVRMQVHV